MQVIIQGTYSANCVCECGHHYLFMAMLPADQTKCPCCMNPEPFKDAAPAVIDCKKIKLSDDSIAEMKLPHCTPFKFINEGCEWEGYKF